MNGLSRTAGIGPRVTINGKEYQVRGKTNRFYTEVEAELLKLRGDPFEMIVEAGKQAKLHQDVDLLNQIADVITAKFRNWRVMTYWDYIEFMNSPTGDALTVFHCLKQDDPTLTFDEVKYWLTTTRILGDKKGSEEIDAVFKAINVASGEDQLGNSTGQPREPTTPILAQTGI